MRCDFCSQEAIAFLRYSGAHLCEEHFCESVERKIKKEFRRQADLKRGDVLGVAVSGGKDSMAMLSVLRSIFDGKNGVRLVCISIDEGIDGYRPPSLDIVRNFCDENSVEYRERSFSEFGFTMDEVAKVSGENTPCTYCGVFRRKLMNDEAKKINAKFLATGHNLDDLAQSVMMNFTRGDIERMSRLGPHRTVKPGLIRRVYPLRSVPEKEVLMYDIIKGIPHWDGVCPYWEAALRNRYRDLVDSLEEHTPGTKYSILSSYDTLRPALDGMFRKSADMNICECGEPCNSARCKACEYRDILIERIKNL